jgi:hypothetical protein
VGKERLSLTGQAGQWQTPATDSFRSRGGERVDEMGLDQQARYWPTPDTPSGGPRTHKTEREGKEQVSLEDVAQNWSTPKAGDRGADWTKKDRSTTGQGLEEQAALWSTPRAEDGESCGNHPGRKGGDSLTGQIQHWRTPTAMDSEQAGGKGRFTRRGKTTLHLQTNMWPTPEARDYRSGETVAEYGNSRPLNEAVLKFSHPVQVLDESGRKLSDTRRILRPRLNPAFVCWLMGWPTLWTRAEPISCGAQVTESWRCKLRWLLWYFCGEQNF